MRIRLIHLHCTELEPDKQTIVAGKFLRPNTEPTEEKTSKTAFQENLAFIFLYQQGEYILFPTNEGLGKYITVSFCKHIFKF